MEFHVTLQLGEDEYGREEENFETLQEAKDWIKKRKEEWGNFPQVYWLFTLMRREDVGS